MIGFHELTEDEVFVTEKAAKAACFLAMKVITQVGARLHHGTRKFWEQAMA